MTNKDYVYVLVRPETAKLLNKAKMIEQKKCIYRVTNNIIINAAITEYIERRQR